MTLPASGPISMSEVNVELAYPATQLISLNDAAVRFLAGVPAGVISMSNLYGKSNITPSGYRVQGQVSFPPAFPGPVALGSNTIWQFVFSTETATLLGTTWPTSSPGPGQYGFSYADKAFYAPTPVAGTITTFAFSTNTYGTQAYTGTATLWGKNMIGPDNDSAYTRSISGPPNSIWRTSKFTKSTSTYTVQGTPYSHPVQNPTNGSACSYNAKANYAKAYFGSSSVWTLTFSTESMVVSGFGEYSDINAITSAYFNSTERGWAVTGLGPNPLSYPVYIASVAFSTGTGVRLYQNAGFNLNNSAGIFSPVSGYTLSGQQSRFPAPTIYYPATNKYPFATQTITVLGAPSSFGQKQGGATFQSTPQAAT